MFDLSSIALDPSPRLLRVAVVGAGRWGRLHAAKLARMPGVRLVAVVDRAPDRARAAVAELGASDVRPLTHLDGLPDDLHAATVAVDLPQLAGVAGALLDRGLHVLAEKPLALDGATAATLVERAARRSLILAVGYLERFRADVPPDDSARRIVARRVAVPRVGAPAGFDRLVHDVDHALRLLGPGLVPVLARFDDERARLHLIGPDGREARLYTGPHRQTRRQLWCDGRRIDLAAGHGDPLAEQLAAFVAAATGRPDPRLATGREALAVLRLLDAARAVRSAA